MMAEQGRFFGMFSCRLIMAFLKCGRRIFRCFTSLRSSRELQHRGSEYDTPLTSFNDTTPSSISGTTILVPSPPLCLLINFHLDDRIHMRHLDFSTFAHWSAIHALQQDLLNDGLRIVSLHDVHANTPIGSGDWDARVYPGMEVDVFFSDGLSCAETEEDDSEYNSDDEESREEWSHACRKKHWWFERWRVRVEHDRRNGRVGKREPGWKAVVLGALGVLGWIGVVVICLL
jgi:hypothetical protein